MNNKACQKCQDIISGKSNLKHEDLERNGLSKSVGYHGNRDDEYNYKCKVCKSNFVGDSCGIWPSK